MKLSDVVLCLLLAVIAAGVVKAVFLPGHSPPDTQESPLFRETLARSLNDFAASEAVLDPYAPGRKAASVAKPSAKPEILFEQAVGFYQKGNFGAAADRLEQVRRARPKSFEACHLLGDCYLMLGRHEKAADAYRATVEIDPSHGRSYLLLGDAYKSMGDYAEAEAAYRKAVECSPEDAAAHASLGGIFAIRGRHEEARREYQYQIDRLKGLMKKEPDETGHAIHLASFYINHGIEQEEATALLRAARSERPDDNQVAFLLARANLAGGRLERAVEILEKIIPTEADPEKKRYYTNFLKAIQEPPEDEGKTD